MTRQQTSEATKEPCTKKRSTCVVMLLSMDCGLCERSVSLIQYLELVLRALQHLHTFTIGIVFSVNKDFANGAESRR